MKTLMGFFCGFATACILLLPGSWDVYDALGKTQSAQHLIDAGFTITDPEGFEVDRFDFETFDKETFNQNLSYAK